MRVRFKRRVFLPLKRLMPSSLFARALLIVVIPTVLVQIVAIYIFYARHWDSVTRNISASLAGELSLLVHEMQHDNLSHRVQWMVMAKDQLGINLRFSDAPMQLPHHPDAHYESFRAELKERLGYPVSVRPFDDDTLLVRIGLPDQVLEALVSRKRLESSTTYIFIIWLVSSSLVLMIIAIVFLRNQIRPISKLARAAESFGMGSEEADLRPSGSREIRQAGRAFLIMRARIRRQLATRTAMLSGISHDLRTPLTRMKLQLALMPPSDELAAMGRDVEEMEEMIGEYLDFARGEDGQISEPTAIAAFLETIVGAYRQVGQPVELMLAGDALLPLRRARIRRAFDNLITNALRYGGACRISVEIRPRLVAIQFEDDGPGIPESEQDTVFMPFRRLEDSRNIKTGGVGLGLTIAREAVTTQGGSIALSNRVEEGRIAGLRVVVRLPLSVV